MKPKSRFKAKIDPPLQMRLRLPGGQRPDVTVVGYIQERSDGCSVYKNQVIMPDGSERVVLNNDLYTPRERKPKS